jgi:4-hydroxymandelate oxidase
MFGSHSGPGRDNDHVPGWRRAGGVHLHLPHQRRAIGVSHILHILRAELDVTMALMGCRNLDAITAAAIRR